jgi:hypothetical protein
MKSFCPIDWKHGLPVNNLLCATMFTDAEMKKVKSQLQRAASKNPAWKFEFRSIV